MGSLTPNYSLFKPDATDLVDQEVDLNANFDKIDTALAAIYTLPAPTQTAATDTAAFVAAVAATRAGQLIQMQPDNAEGGYVVTSLPPSLLTRRLVGAGRTATTVTVTGAGDGLTVPAAATTIGTWQDFTLTNTVTGGHLIFLGAGATIANSLFFSVAFTQNNPAKSIISAVSNGGYIFNEHFFTFWNGTGNGHLVPLVNIVTQGNCNANNWRKTTASYTGNYWVHMEDSSNVTFVRDNTFSDTTFEVCNGGGIRIWSGYNCTVEHYGFEDLAAGVGGSANRDLIVIGRQSGLPSLQNKIGTGGRRGGDLLAAVATTIAAGSNGQSLPQAVINVASTAGAAASGTIYVVTAAGFQSVDYTGVAAGQFTGCTGGTGAMTTGGRVTGGTVDVRLVTGQAPATMLENLGSITGATFTIDYGSQITVDVNNTAANIVKLNCLSTWQTVTAFTNSWAAAGGAYSAPSYRLSADGRSVQLGGGITGGSGNTAAFTLPAGFRPLTLKSAPLANGSTGAVTIANIAATGVVTLFGGAAGDSRCLDGITVPVDL